jgi:hypothetical protein
MPAGDRTPLRRHTQEDETFVVLDARARFLVGDDLLEVGAGHAAQRAARRAARLPTLDPARWLTVVTGRAGFDRFVEDLGRQVTDLAGPAQPEPDLDRVVAVAAVHDIEILGPPPAALAT